MGEMIVVTNPNLTRKMSSDSSRRREFGFPQCNGTFSAEDRGIFDRVIVSLIVSSSNDGCSGKHSLEMTPTSIFS